MSGHLDSAEWGPILYKDITTSTMDDARQALTEGGGHGTVCAAGTQESGRGRVEGRRWLDDGSALLFTVILEKNRVTAVYPPTQLMALCLCRYLEKAHRLTAEIKWPNDVLVSGGKIAGILVEASGGFYLGGMGVNISQREFTQPLRRPAVSLAVALEGREERSGVAKSAPEGGPAEPGSPTASAGGRGPADGGVGSGSRLFSGEELPAGVEGVLPEGGGVGSTGGSAGFGSRLFSGEELPAGVEDVLPEGGGAGSADGSVGSGSRLFSGEELPAGVEGVLPEGGPAEPGSPTASAGGRGPVDDGAGSAGWPPPGGACPSAEEVLRGFLEELGRALAAPPPIGEIERRICGLGQEMSLLVGDPARNESLTGVMEGLGNDGSLLLRDRAGHLHHIYSGEINLN